MTEFDKVKTMTGRTTTHRGWLDRDSVIGKVVVDVLWRCKQCKEYFTTEQAKEHKHDNNR